uniref:DUF4150 domain-containing protein n=1 Tax=Meloidogyne hapla TaxID=6305 RepID=A0A1I8BUW9_MELHA
MGVRQTGLRQSGRGKVGCVKVGCVKVGPNEAIIESRGHRRPNKAVYPLLEVLSARTEDNT